MYAIPAKTKLDMKLAQTKFNYYELMSMVDKVILVATIIAAVHNRILSEEAIFTLTFI